MAAGLLCGRRFARPARGPAAGLGVAVADACVELRQAAHYVTTAPGGSGAVREVVELILRSQHRWDDVIQTYR